ncbi:MAG: carbohydrate binding domain-containing protein, partial [bacterium]
KINDGLILVDEDYNFFKYDNPNYKLSNSIPNPSFEDGLWEKEVDDCHDFDNNSKIAIALDTKEKTDGNYSLQLEAERHIACTSKIITVKGGGSYQFSFDYQSPNAEHSSYYLGFNDKNKTLISEDLDIKDSEWNTFTKTIKVPEGATQVAIYVYADSTDGKTNIVNRYDNFKLIEVPDLSDAYYLVSEPEKKLVEPKSIQFDLINPTKKLVHIKGATTPFYLAMSESYHDKWQLQFNDNKINGFFDSWMPFVKPNRIPDEYHYKLNDFLNAWYVDTDQYCKNNNLCIKNADGSYDIEMTIEFFPQRWFYLGLLISGTTLVGCIGYLGYEGIKSIKRRRKSKYEKDN